MYIDCRFCYQWVMASDQVLNTKCWHLVAASAMCRYQLHRVKAVDSSTLGKLTSLEVDAHVDESSICICKKHCMCWHMAAASAKRYYQWHNVIAVDSGISQVLPSIAQYDGSSSWQQPSAVISDMWWQHEVMVSVSCRNDFERWRSSCMQMIHATTYAGLAIFCR